MMMVRRRLERVSRSKQAVWWILSVGWELCFTEHGKVGTWQICCLVDCHGFHSELDKDN